MKGYRDMKDELIDEELEIKELDADTDEEDDELKKRQLKRTERELL